MSNIVINNNNSTSNGNPAKTKTITTVPAKFKYMIWNPAFLTEKPFQILIPIPKSAADQRATNVDFEEGPEEVVTDAREVGFESKSGLESGKSGLKFGFDLDRHGFVYLRGHRSCLYAGRDDAGGKRLFYDPAVVNARYLPECVELVRRVLGIEGRDRDRDQGRVELFGWRRRKTGALPEGGRPGSTPTDVVLGPARAVHVDQTLRAVRDLVRERFPDEAEELLKCRIRTLIIWRPIGDPVEDWPLAVSDAATVPPSCLVETERIRPKYRGPTYYTPYREGIKWYYLRSQRNDEPVIMKSFDSKEGVAGYCAHAAFKLADAPPNARPRESIEVRAIVFTKE